MDNYLQEGIAAAKAGDKPRAFDLLTRASATPATSEQAWLWLSSVVKDDEERLFCLNNVLRINPANVAAKRGADIFRQKGIFPAMPVYPEPQRKAPVQSFNPEPAAPQPAPFSFRYEDPEQTQASPVPVVPPKPQQSSYESDWKKQEVAGYYESAVMGLANKRSTKAMEKSLISRGASPEIAKAVVKEADDAVCKARREEYKKRMKRGFLWAVVGFIISCCTYQFADSLGGKFYVFYGAVIFGLIDLVIGFFGWLANL
ncbi:MAG: hypothetical protein IPO22_00560 [Anaerolineales bacterium]|nr:hypothetical protein [Anaerolineales bacterium]